MQVQNVIAIVSNITAHVMVINRDRPKTSYGEVNQ